MSGNAYVKIRPLRACLLASVLAIAAAGLACQASASALYDGTWSVVITTRTGTCDPIIRYGVEILNGAVTNSGGGVDVSGQVSRDGVMRVSVRSGEASAEGLGHLGRETGSGTWRGQGSRGACEGTWTAQRRSV